MMKLCKIFCVLICVFSLLMCSRKPDDRIKQHFSYNNDKFDSVYYIAKKIIGNYDFELLENDRVRFLLCDTILPDSSFEGIMYSIGSDSKLPIRDLKFDENNELCLYYNTNKLLAQKWILDFEGQQIDTLFIKMLGYNAMSQTDVRNLLQYLKELGFSRISRNGVSVTLYSNGKKISNYVILIPLTKRVISSDWHNLDDRYYWKYYQNDLVD